tara:strand:- start:312 stop:917 length:606 start_codon:yes stop_codon:yes gene_type:complete
MVNYKNGLIYKLVSKDLDIKHCYIGSTTCLKERKRQHRFCCNNPHSKAYNNLKYKIIRENGGFANWEMVLIHYYPCETKLELHKEERRIKEVYNDDMGMSIPSRTKIEWNAENKDHIKDYLKQYNEDNKDKISRSQKQYKEDNKDHIKDYRKQYREENKNKISEYGKIKIECNVCNCMVRKGDIARHRKSKKHINNLNNST